VKPRSPSSEKLASASRRSRCGFDHAAKSRQVAELEERSRSDDFWNDASRAQAVMKQISDLRDEVDRIGGVESALSESLELLEILGDEPGVEGDVDASITRAQLVLDELEMAANFDRPYDAHGAIVTIRAGAGGTDAADWVAMLARMYLKWAEGHGMTTQIAEEAPGDEAGLRSITFFLRGRNAYGMLESERGVHRLVRISPFDQAHRRQTSFAEVDVVPETQEGDPEEIEIRPEDLRIETFKAGGAGGQYVNKTESAIRIIHIPTNTIVASQQERSQMQNRDVAMTILRAKLIAREREERDAKLAELRGERKANEWGSQIRSYVLNPYQLVKDHRTNVETGNVGAVLEGDIDGFMWPYLQRRNEFSGAA
jgi:peptide chain release factor 2